MIRAASVLGFAVVLFGLPAPVAAQPTSYAASIHAGRCGDLAGVVADLNDAVIASGERSGHVEAQPAANAFSTVPVSLDALVATDHAVVVQQPGDGEILACGEIGGFPTDDGALILGLSGMSDPSVAGVAYVAPGSEPAQTDVSVFFVLPSGEGAPESPSLVGDGDDSLSDIGQAESPIASDDERFASGGLGLSLVDWQSLHGSGADTPGSLGLSYEDGQFDALAFDDGNIRWLEVRFGFGVPFGEARLLASLYMPDDAELVGSYVAEFGLPIDLYFSESLRARFTDPDDWPEAEPGQFIVIYGQFGPPEGTGDVTTLVMALGNAP